VSPSQFLLAKHREAGLATPRTAVVRNGIPQRAPDQAKPADGIVRFLLLCRLTREKGVSVVLDAVRRLPRELCFELTIAGRGPLEPLACAAAEADPRVRFVGFVQGDAKHALLSAADHLLIPSLWYENAPVAIVEAAAYGIGVIGSRIGGIPELVEEGATGLLAEPGDAAGLAAIMQNLASGEVRLNRLREATRAVAARHAVAPMIEAYLEHYRALKKLPLPLRQPAKAGVPVSAGSEPAGNHNPPTAA
jgi:glycosyltransferase involved in cell wall biosynthesis